MKCAKSQSAAFGKETRSLAGVEIILFKTNISITLLKPTEESNTVSSRIRVSIFDRKNVAYTMRKSMGVYVYVYIYYVYIYIYSVFTFLNHLSLIEFVMMIQLNVCTPYVMKCHNSQVNSNKNGFDRKTWREETSRKT
jgi:hypothetical protein